MSPQDSLRTCSDTPRVFIVSDISNEPDDAESLVRYLLYSNEFDTRGIVACTSTWMRHVVHPEDLETIIHAYGRIVPNLNCHVHPSNRYRTAEELLELVSTGPALYGKEALAAGVPLSPGASLLIDRLDESEAPLWVLCWGGTNVLAQALKHMQDTRSVNDCCKLRSKLRVYAISDQDDTGMWIRLTFPDIFYIASVHGWNQYGMAAWTGISGEHYYNFDHGGPNAETVSKDWLKTNIQIGDFGSTYPDFLFIPEGDTPTFLYLIQNGLGSRDHPEWGSWGGRYTPIDATLTTRHYSDAVDRVTGQDGRVHSSNHATIWRWRDAFQNDFAARMRWTLTSDFSMANHAPVVIINDGSAGPEPLFLKVEAGSDVVLDASKSYDPDQDELTFTWFHYKDVTATQWLVDADVAAVTFHDLDKKVSGKIVKAKLPPAEMCAIDMFTGRPQETGQVMHLILEVKDNGVPSMRTYKRVVVQIINPKLEGGRATAAESIAGVHMGDQPAP